MVSVKVPGSGEKGAYVELVPEIEIRDVVGNPNGTGKAWEPSRWELWDGEDFIWQIDYSGTAMPWENDPKEAAERQIKAFAALYTLGKQSITD